MSKNTTPAEHLIQIRNHNCPGFPVNRVTTREGADKYKGLNARGNCRLCGKMTTYYCPGCHRYFCDKVRNDYIDDPQTPLENRSYYHQLSPQVRIERTCMVISHEDARERMFNGKWNQWAPFVGNANECKRTGE